MRGFPAHAPFVGRQHELAALTAQVDAALAGQGRIVLVTGDAGLGKSRLVARIRPPAEERGFLILQGACFPQDRAEPYAPIVDVLRARFAGRPPAAIAAAGGPFVADLQSLLPDLLPPSEQQAAAPSEPDRRRLFAALAHCLGEQAGPRPALLVVEDLHWCDEASLDFFFYLARRPRGHPFLLIGTCRDEEVTPHLRAWLALLEREGLAEQVPVAPLSRDDVDTMARAYVDGRHLPAATLDALAALAEGNPFCVEELLSSLVLADGSDGSDVSGDVVGMDALRLPRSLHAAVQQRVERLSPAARNLLQLAAVAGRRFDVGLLRQLAGLDEPGFVSLLQELADAQLVVEEPGGGLAFRHALTRQVVYTELLTRTRAMLHGHAGEAAEQVYATSLDQHLGDLAEHFYWAEVWDKAQAYARRAGERALRLYASRAAVEQFSRALEANRRMAHAEEMEEFDASLLRLAAAAAHRGRGRAYDLLGSFAQALADYEAAIDLAGAAGDRRQQCVSLLDAGLLWASRDYARAGGRFRDALDLARRLGEPELLADSLNRLGNWHANTDEPWRAPALHHEALAIVTAAGDRPRIAGTLDLLGMACYLNLDLADSMAYFEQAAALFRELGDHPGLVSCLTMLAVRGGSYEIPVMGSSNADIAAGLAAGEEALALALAIDSPAGEAFAALQLAGIRGPLGEYGLSLVLAERGLRVAETIGHRQWMAAVHDMLGMVYLDLLAPERARRHLDQARALAREVASTYWNQKTAAVAAIAHLQWHEPDRAAAILAEVPSPEGHARTVGQWWMMYAHARLALARRAPDLALGLCDRLRRPAADEQRTGEIALELWLRAEALRALDRPAEAEAILRRVCTATRHQGARSQLWRIHAALGDLCREAGRGEDARREFAAARAVIEDVAGGLTDEGLRDQFLHNATALLPRAYRLSPLTSAAARFGGLTAREREVAALIARGKSNREIAEALVLGRRTVETHIANILTKLRVDSRQAIAAWAADRELTADP